MRRASMIESLPKQDGGVPRQGIFAGLAQKWSEALDGTGAFRRRAMDPEVEGYRSNGGGGRGGINLPQSFVLGLVMYLIAQGVGGIWWAATQQAKNDSQAAELVRLNEEVSVLKLQNSTQQSNMDERIRGKVREALDDWGYYRPSKEK
jgi:hypothetical protein